MTYLIGLMLSVTFIVGAAFGASIAEPDPPCLEDEVYAWFGDFPDDIRWECIPFDNLVTVKVTTPPHTVSPATALEN